MLKQYHCKQTESPVDTFDQMSMHILKHVVAFDNQIFIPQIIIYKSPAVLIQFFQSRQLVYFLLFPLCIFTTCISLCNFHTPSYIASYLVLYNNRYISLPSKQYNIIYSAHRRLNVMLHAYFILAVFIL